jgi:glycosyltransferase involved in cell wall biosynthesis
MDLTLGMLVKNEQEIVGRAIESAAPFVKRAVIIDTGSNDETKKIVREKCREHKIKLVLLDRPWKSYGYNRTELLAEIRRRSKTAKRPNEYALLLDADMIVNKHGRQPKLKADGYLIKYEGSEGYRQPLLVKAQFPWIYKGATHEFLDGEEERAPQWDTLDYFTIDHRIDGSNRVHKFVSDKFLLEQEISRSVFYLAQTCANIGDTKRAVELYLQRAKMGGWVEEVYYSLWQAGVHAPWPEGFGYLADAAQLLPNRMEALYEIARRCREHNQFLMAALFLNQLPDEYDPPEGLFVDNDVYRFKVLFEKSLVAFHTGNKAHSKEMFDRLRAMDLPASYRDALEANAKFYEEPKDEVRDPD